MNIDIKAGWPKIVHKITSLLSCPEFIAQHRTHPKHVTRQRHLTFRNLILFLLNQPKSALQTELDAFFQTLNGSVFETRVVTAQAFSKRLLINKLNKSFRANAIIPVAVKLATFDVDGG